MSRVVIITGASAGIGKTIAQQLLKEKWIVYATARRLDKLKDLESQGAKINKLDVTDDTTISEVVDLVIEKEGRIDALVNNAGYGSYGAVEDVSIDEARRQFEVNVFGLARVTQLVLPHMRKQKSGRIVNISSMGGKFTIPMGGWYHSTKHALESISDALRQETKQFGIDVIVIQPGTIRSEWSDIATQSLEEVSGKGAYANWAQAMIKVMDRAYKDKNSKASSPQVIADVVSKALNAKRPKTRYAAPFGAKFLIFGRWLLSDRMLDSRMKANLNPEPIE